MNSAIHISKLVNLNNQSELLQLESDEFIEVIQYTPTSVTFEIANVFVGKGQRVSMSGQIYINKKKFNFDATAEIIQYQVVTNSLVQFEFQIIPNDTALWEKFIDSKKSSQIHVDQLLQKMKGVI